MSFYDLAFPDPTRAARVMTLCGVLGVGPGDFGRLRDAWVEVVGDDVQLGFYARIGGGNRGEHTAAIAALRSHPGYLSDRDDAFDPTYATFRFRLPVDHAESLMPGLPEVLRSTAHIGELDTDQRWRDAIDRVHRGEISPAQVAGFDQVVAGIRQALREPGGETAVVEI